MAPAVASSPARWQPPPPGLFKLNIDAAIDTTKHTIGVGAVVRNSSGRAIAAFSMPTVGLYSSHEMEAKAMFLSLNWALQLQLQVSIVETDALMVSNALNNKLMAVSSFNDLILDITSLLSFFPNIVVTHVKRSANAVADCLAKYALGRDESISWMENFPPSINSVIVNDYPL
ncbi:uncharacterized protein LOC133034133 [Cannabis sativa]|uniref:uncharacterized protein LOC133034133 n=1 Tax=Cannabis sativa TaxID=3483 RepID=UPI0029CA4B12|nr:uncharacterized protein LOC133034133 [Cannabis sativa]